MELNENLATIVYSGKIDGDILSSDSVVIADHSEIEGDISADDVFIGNHVVIKGNVDAKKGDVSIGDMCEIFGDVTAEDDVSVGQMTVINGDVIAKDMAYIQGFSVAYDVFGDVEVVAENNCDLEAVQSFGVCTLATKVSVSVCCGTEMVDCFDEVEAECLMSETEIQTGKSCNIGEMMVKKPK